MYFNIFNLFILLSFFLYKDHIAQVIELLGGFPKDLQTGKYSSEIFSSHGNNINKYLYIHNFFIVIFDLIVYYILVYYYYYYLLI